MTRLDWGLWMRNAPIAANIIVINCGGQKPPSLTLGPLALEGPAPQCRGVYKGFGPRLGAHLPAQLNAAAGELVGLAVEVNEPIPVFLENTIA